MLKSIRFEKLGIIGFILAVGLTLLPQRVATGQSAVLTSRELKKLVAAGQQRYQSIVYTGTVSVYDGQAGGAEFSTQVSFVRLSVIWTPTRVLGRSKSWLRFPDGTHVPGREGYLFNRTFTKSYDFVAAHLGAPQPSRVGSVWHGCVQRCSLIPPVLWADWFWLPIGDSNSQVTWDSHAERYVITTSFPTPLGTVRNIARVSPALGFLPTRYEFFHPGARNVQWVIRFSRFREVAKGLWLPFRCVNTSYVPASSKVPNSLGPVKVVYTISKAKVNVPIPAASFKLAFPRGTSVSNAISDLVYQVYRVKGLAGYNTGATEITPPLTTSVSSRLLRTTAQMPPGAAVAVPSDRKWYNTLLFLLTFAGVAAIFLFAILILRRKSGGK